MEIASISGRIDSLYPSGTKTGVPRGEASKAGSLTSEEQRQIEALSATDRRVRAHEQAHVSAGGGLVRGGASFSYRTGPDGKRYAVAGEVDIDTSKGRTPAETISKAERIRAAALAPADPSGQDRSVAAEAAQMAAEARQQETRESSASGPRAAAVASAYQSQPLSPHTFEAYA